jgi:hypothetical protein
MSWSRGRGLLGPLKPLLGSWVAEGQHNGMPFTCTRRFEPFGKGWIRLEATWTLPGVDYRETALFGRGEDDALGVFSFTNDGKRSVGRLADGTDIDPAAVAFEAQMPAGLARMSYWPAEDGQPGFRFAVESRTKAGWNRFVLQHYRPAPQGRDAALDPRY